jgi:hypothetical protein
MSGTEHKNYTNTEEGRSERSYFVSDDNNDEVAIRARRDSLSVQVQQTTHSHTKI